MSHYILIRNYTTIEGLVIMEYKYLTARNNINTNLLSPTPEQNWKQNS